MHSASKSASLGFNPRKDAEDAQPHTRLRAWLASSFMYDSNFGTRCKASNPQASSILRLPPTVGMMNDENGQVGTEPVGSISFHNVSEQGILMHDRHHIRQGLQVSPKSLVRCLRMSQSLQGAPIPSSPTHDTMRRDSFLITPLHPWKSMGLKDLRILSEVERVSRCLQPSYSSPH
ncbi:uncharacterized protein BDR25DRAFT_350223 [Lindgomyces ingoldianus]|uniref:Uncharacterized protein n=1 Tax=Lindgomyces ingoldianus TaxID=673940 RepID=A0ACB6R9X5_9PLEO|nr:uncharacterized protein BDR25DRAFT_350223 [Lindgomyces ingoldianus]KAF2475946.1 hypothetical protein BDR25DRAFT_350223 [Lindgomyces ingoldianus]